MLDLRQRIFIISGISVGLIIAIILGIIYLGNSDEGKEDSASDTTNVTDSNNPQVIFVPSNEQVVTKPEGSPEEIYVKNLARIFVERFSTYSNQNNNEHITELESLATPSMWQWAQTQTLEQNSEYNGLVTEVLGASLTSFDKELGQAKVAIEVQQKTLQENQDGNVEETTVQKSADVDIKKLEGVWLVDGIWWEK